MPDRDRAQRGNSAREATRDGSRQTATRSARSDARSEPPTRAEIAILATGLTAGLLMLISLFMTVASVNVAQTSCEVINDTDPTLADRCALTGFERHSIAFLLLGILALAMSYAAGPGRSRPAALGLIVLGVIAVGLALLVDLPVTNDTGIVGRDFEGATASAGLGLWVELVSGSLAIAAGGGALLPRPGDRRRRPQRDRPRRPRQDTTSSPRTERTPPRDSSRSGRSRTPPPPKGSTAPRRRPPRGEA